MSATYFCAVGRTEMLKFIVSRANRKGLKRIDGNFSSIDTEQNPKLPEWYAKRGFTIKSSGGGIYMNLELMTELRHVIVLATNGVTFDESDLLFHKRGSSHPE